MDREDAQVEEEKKEEELADLPKFSRWRKMQRKVSWFHVSEALEESFGDATAAAEPSSRTTRRKSDKVFAAVHSVLPGYYLRRLDDWLDEYAQDGAFSVTKMSQFVFCCGRTFSPSTLQEIVKALTGQSHATLQREEFSSLVYVINTALQSVYSSDKVCPYYHKAQNQRITTRL